jgi:hypothetical protein
LALPIGIGIGIAYWSLSTVTLTPQLAVTQKRNEEHYRERGEFNQKLQDLEGPLHLYFELFLSVFQIGPF